MVPTAVVLANGLLRTPFAKTTHGLIRGPSRYHLVGVIDPDHAGLEAGQVLDGTDRGLPVFANLDRCLDAVGSRPDACIVGVATVGGVLPTSVRASLLEAARTGMNLVNGLHQLLADDREIAGLVAANGGSIHDIRRPKPASELRFWTGEVLALDVPRIAVLGTDCAVGKRTTAMMLSRECRRRGLRAEMIYTGQTGWMQGARYGFVFDAVINDYVSGEVEHAIVTCDRESEPDVMIIEGQSSLRNPSGPCGAEFLLSGGARAVVLQHAPGREYFEGYERQKLRIPPLADEIALIAMYGARTLAVTLNGAAVSDEALIEHQKRYERELGIPVVRPLHEGVERLVPIVREYIDSQHR